MRIFFTLFVIMTGCTSVPQKLDEKTFYKRDMSLTVNGHQAEGVLVVPRAKEYIFEIQAKGKLDLFTFTTCHREQTKENAGERGWFADSKRRELTFRPVPLESEGVACPARLGGFERIKGRHSWGFVEFEHPSLVLPALVSCNGAQYNSRGVSACQAREGLLMEIRFPERVLWPDKNVCVKLESSDAQTFRFKVPRGECSIRFVTERGEKKWHRLVIVGYEKILIRED